MYNKIYAYETSTHILCFGAKIRKIGIPLHTPFIYTRGRNDLGAKRQVGRNDYWGRND